MLLEQMKKTGKYLIYEQDILYMEGVLEYLSKNNVDILITKDTLSGDLTKQMYIKQIKEISPNTKVILFTENLNEEYKGFLFANNVFNIIEDKEITFSKIFNVIESKENNVIYSYNIPDKLQTNQGSKIDIPKQLISIFGTSGAGKSYVSSIIGQILSKIMKLNTLLIDMDIQNPALDIYNNIDGEVNALYYVMEEVDNDCFNSSVLKEFSKRERENRRLSFLTNNLDMYECQNRIAPSYYNILYKEAIKNFDMTLLDMPASPFLDVVPFSLSKSNIIFFVINPNFISIRQAHKYLDLMINVWNINKDKIKLIVNKTSKDSLSIKQISSMLKDYDICLEIARDDEIEQVINGIKKIDITKIKNTYEFQNVFNLQIEESSSNFVKKMIGVKS